MGYDIMRNDWQEWVCISMKQDLNIIHIEKEGCE